MGRLRDWLNREHVNCKDPNCLNKVDIEVWCIIAEAETCCGICGCCPCRSYLCSWCRMSKWPLSWWHTLTWKLWNERKFNKYLESLRKQ